MDKLSSDKKLEEIMRDFSDKIVKEKGVVLDNVESELRALTQLNQQLEERLFKQENLIDRLTRDKVSLTNEVESYKKKCDSIDFDTHQVLIQLYMLFKIYIKLLSRWQTSLEPNIWRLCVKKTLHRTN